MRITFTLPPFSPRPVGGFRVVYEYSNRLVERGHEVAIVHLLNLAAAPESLLRRLRNVAGRALRVFFKPRLWWQDLDKRVKVLHVPAYAPARIPDGDAIFATAWMTAKPVLECPASKGTKFYLVMDFDPWLAPKDLLEATWRWPLKKVTISDWLRDKVVACGAPPEDTVNVPIAIDHARFRMLRDIANRPERIAMLYGFSAYKATEVGLQALELAKQQRPAMHATVFGYLPRPSGMPAWIDYRRNLSEPDMVELYNESRLYVCSSTAEGFALPPAEAAACGCAIASTDCGGIREYADNESTALLSPPNDPRTLAQNIIRLLENEELRQRLARTAYERVKALTWERSTDLLEHFVARQRAVGAIE